MNNQKIEPGKVTKPIQLVAAWLVGLIIVNAAFLATSVGIDEPVMLKAILIYASIINVPLFLGAIFLLQTKFRPQLQEDSFYSKYLDSKTNQVVTKSKQDSIEIELAQIKSIAQKRVAVSIDSSEDEVLSRYNIGLNDHLSNFTEIRGLLKKRTIPLNTIFGSVSTTDIPGKNIMTFAHDLDFKAKVAAIKLGAEIGVEGYNYFDPREEDSEEDILIGAYGYDRGYTPITKQLKEIVNNNPEPVDVKYYEHVTKAS
jgi:hypothetical protein